MFISLLSLLRHHHTQPTLSGAVSVQMDGVLCGIHAVCFCIKHLSVAVELGHASLLVDKEGMEYVKIVQ